MVVVVITLAAFVPAQLSLENRITAKLPEIKLVFGLLVTGLLSVPLALNPTNTSLDPQVDVSLDKASSYRYSVIGGRGPAWYSLDEPKDDRD